ncbi:MAG TPA: TIM barrel protein [Phototrophicaceae bacterium]|nr:TIM barrel protein [Phototrophicaceae bacterium]
MKDLDLIRFGTVGSPQTTPADGTPAAIEHIKQLGLGHLEIAWVRSVRVTDESCAEIKATAKKHGITLSIHAPYYINLNSQTAEKMAASDERLLAAARKGFLAGARDIVFHPGSYHTQPPEGVYQRGKEKLLELTGILRDEGVDVILRPETMGKGAMLGTLEETVRWSQEVPGILPCIDWAHLHARRGDGSFNSYAEFSEALELLKSIPDDRGIKNAHFHISGIDYGAKGEKAHLPLNEADLHYRELLQAFVDYGIEGTAAIEAPEPFHTADCLTFQATYRRLAGAPVVQEED